MKFASIQKFHAHFIPLLMVALVIYRFRKKRKPSEESSMKADKSSFDGIKQINFYKKTNTISRLKRLRLNMRE